MRDALCRSLDTARPWEPRPYGSNKTNLNHTYLFYLYETGEDQPDYKLP